MGNGSRAPSRHDPGSLRSNVRCRYLIGVLLTYLLASHLQYVLRTYLLTCLLLCKKAPLSLPRSPFPLEPPDATGAVAELGTGKEEEEKTIDETSAPLNTTRSLPVNNFYFPPPSLPPSSLPPKHSKPTKRHARCTPTGRLPLPALSVLSVLSLLAPSDQPSLARLADRQHGPYYLLPSSSRMPLVLFVAFLSI